MANTKIDSSSSGSSSSGSSSASGTNSPTPKMTKAEREEQRVHAVHIKLLSPSEDLKEFNEAVTTPIFTMPALDHMKSKLARDAESPIPQYGLLAGVTDGFPDDKDGEKQQFDERLFYNITSPSSTFICGSQVLGNHIHSRVFWKIPCSHLMPTSCGIRLPAWSSITTHSWMMMVAHLAKLPTSLPTRTSRFACCAHQPMLRQSR